MDGAGPVLAAERVFFTGLMEADLAALESVLADDFMLIDVMQGAEVPARRCSPWLCRDN
jgi:hypothetical protein